MSRKKLNTKIPIIAGAILFIIISIVVINAKDMQTISRVKFSNKDIVISHGDTGFNNTEVGFNNAGSFNNRGVDGGHTDVNIGNNGHFGNQGTNFDNQGNFSNADGSFNNNGNFSNQNTGFENQGEFGNADGNMGNVGEYGNQDWESNNSNGNYGNYNVGFDNQNYRSDSNRYRQQNIDWGTWKSNFVNRILDDSMYIKSLDTYGIGTWFYYSFDVTDKGEIKDVTVFSLYLSDADKKEIRKLIRSYAHQPITIFPKDSKRKKAKVKAVMLLGDTESKSDASNFRDIEKVKIKY